MTQDYWTEGYRAGLSGKHYADNPYEGGHGATAWAFGCSQGISDRNKEAFKSILAALSGQKGKGLNHGN